MNAGLVALVICAGLAVLSVAVGVAVGRRLHETSGWLVPTEVGTLVVTLDRCTCDAQVDEMDDLARWSPVAAGAAAHIVDPACPVHGTTA